MRRPTFISWEQLRVGLLVLVALGLLAVAVIRLGSAANLFTSRYTLYTYVGNANGLREGGSVMVAGQLAGTVKEIQFLPPDGDTLRNLRVALSLDQELQPQVRADSRAKVRTLGLLGDKVVDISVGTPRYSVLQDRDTILTAPTVDYDYVIAQASGAVVDVVQLTSDLRSITGGLARGEGTVGQLLTSRDLYDDFTGTLRQTNQLLTRLQSRNGTLGKLLDDPELYGNLNGAVASLDSLLGQLNSNQGTLGRLLRDDTLYTRLVSVVGGADSLLTLMHSGNGTATKLLTDQELYDRLNKTLTDLNAILEDVRRNPQKYTKGMIKVF